MKYFENFPKIAYTFNKNTVNVQLVTNILARSTFLRDIVGNVDLSYAYLIRDEDTPEVIAHKAYGDAYRSWIVLMFNNITDPNYGWPLKNDVFEAYVQNKYKVTYEEMFTTIHHYEKVVTTKTVINNVDVNETITRSIIGEYDVNHRTGSLIKNPVPDTADTSIDVYLGEEVNEPVLESSLFSGYTTNTSTVHKAVSLYTYEFEENEKKRKIRILDPIYVQRVENEFRELMKNG